MTTPEENEPAETPGVHSFPREIAREHGVSEAIVLSYIAYKVRHSRKRRDGKTWYYGTLDEIREKYPYIGRSTLGEILKRMEQKGLIQRGNHNRRRADRTVWYTVPEEYRNAHERVAILLDVRVATDLGVPEAALFHNLRYWLNKWGEPSHRMSPSELADVLPFDRKTITRGMRRLVEAGYIVKDPKKPGHYSIRESVPDAPTQESVSGETGTQPASTTENPGGENPNMAGTEPDMGEAEPDESGTKPDSVTHYKPLGNTVGKVPLKNQQTAFPSSQRNPNELHEPHASHPGIRASGHDTGVKGERPGKARINAIAGVSSVSSNPSSRPVKTRSWRSITLDDLRASNAALMTGLSPQEAEGQREQAFRVCDLISRHMDLTTFEAVLEEAESQEAILHELQRALKRSIDSDARFRDLRAREADSSIRLALEIMTILFYQHGKALPPLKPPTWTLPLLEHARSEFSTRTGGIPREEEEEPFVSKDRDKEELADLTPKEKVRVLVSAIDAINKRASDVGGFGRTFRHDAEGRRRALRLFELNPSLAVSHLLSPIHFCLEEIFRRSPEEKNSFDPLFHARNARGLHFFIKHLRKILEQLDEHCSFPTDELSGLQFEEDDEEP